jgi:hypothetical protein
MHSEGTVRLVLATELVARHCTDSGLAPVAVVEEGTWEGILDIEMAEERCNRRKGDRRRRVVVVGSWMLQVRIHSHGEL